MRMSGLCLASNVFSFGCGCQAAHMLDVFRCENTTYLSVTRSLPLPLSFFPSVCASPSLSLVISVSDFPPVSPTTNCRRA